MKQTKLYAPQAYHKLTKEQKENICNGCGSKGTSFVPDTIWFLNITEVCNIHDYMYQVAEPTHDAKKQADRAFLNNMNRVICANTKNMFLRFMRLSRAHKYYLAVSMFGGPAFWDSKNQPEEMGET